MSEDVSRLPKGLFGYRRAVVNQILEDRDIMVRMAEERVRRSESRVLELEGELESVKTHNVRLEEQLARFGEQLDSLSARVDESIEATSAPPLPGEAEARPAATDVPSPEQSTASQLMAEELTSILMAGQEAAARMIERARDEAQRQIVEANHLLGEVHAGVRQFASWREDVQPVIARVQTMVDTVRSHIAQTPERVQHALAPLAEAMLAVDTELLELSGVSQSPFPETTQALEPESTEEHVHIPDVGPADDEGAESIWLTVEEDQVIVSETAEDQMHLEASAG
ncbi:MAG TPA: hypothetical protein VGL18_01005 [Actinomycetota bacterium]|jgi:hypothetical protein